MKVIVPAKTNSTRVPNKNFRPFHGDNNLVDVTLAWLQDLSPYVSKNQIVVSSNEEAMNTYYEPRGYGFHHRSNASTFNHTPISEVLKELADGILDDTDDEVAFAMVCDPLFDAHPVVLQVWEHVKYHGYDSIGIVIPQREHLLDDQLRPMDFGFGRDHRPSQDLPVRYRLNFCFSIVKRDAFDENPYHVGRRPFWYIHEGPSVDIDTMADFVTAQHLYGAFHG